MKTIAETDSTNPIEFQDKNSAWRQLRFLNLYRITLAALFVSSFYIKSNLPLLGGHHPLLFETVSITYLAVSVIASFLIHWRKLDFYLLTYGLITVDILALTLIMRASGGIESGLGMLLVVAIAGNSLLLGSRAANLFAAMAAIAVLGEQVVALYTPKMTPHFAQAGILGAALFATAILAHVLSKRIRESEALAAQRGVDLANLAELNEHVLQHMQSGIIVVDTDARVRLINDSARQMLGLTEIEIGDVSNHSLKVISPELAEQVQDWRSGRLSDTHIIRPLLGGKDILPSMTPIGKRNESGTLIFLEDAARMAQQAQQIKLASLGRLTASIAHEIRNPLGAISHAEQLLSEVIDQNPSDKRLLEIIHTNTSRVNGIIENVLQLSRRERTVPEEIILNTWLGDFIRELCQSEGCENGDILLDIDPDDVKVTMDPSQLHQVLWNLCTNGLRYSPALPGQPRLELRGGLDQEKSRPYLDVIDHGPGINEENVQHIFEPFFTTENKGSGLGLYIASELCQCNQARLSYTHVPSGGSCFHIEFAESPQAYEQVS